MRPDPAAGVEPWCENPSVESLCVVVLHGRVSVLPTHAKSVDGSAHAHCTVKLTPEAVAVRDGFVPTHRLREAPVADEANGRVVEGRAAGRALNGRCRRERSFRVDTGLHLSRALSPEPAIVRGVVRLRVRDDVAPHETDRRRLGHDGGAGRWAQAWPTVRHPAGGERRSAR